MVRFIDEGPSSEGSETENGGPSRFGGAAGVSSLESWPSSRSRGEASAEERDAAAPSAFAPTFAPAWGVIPASAEPARDSAAAGDPSEPQDRSESPAETPASGTSAVEASAAAAPAFEETAVEEPLAPVISLGGRRRSASTRSGGGESGGAESESVSARSASAPAVADNSAAAPEASGIRPVRGIVSDLTTRARKTVEADSGTPGDGASEPASTSAVPPAHTAAFEEYPDTEIPSFSARFGLDEEEEDFEDDGESKEVEEEIVPPTFDEAVELLVRRLARSALSRAEVISEVERLGLENDGAEAVAERLDELGYLDDAVLAEQLKHSLYDRKGKSRQVVAREMAQRKIPNEVIQDALAEVADDDELSAATALAKKRVGQMSSIDDAAAERRLTGFLARRGYPGSIVREAVRAALATRGSRGRVTFR
ncbi:SOS response regulatory protein OraA/RecX [Mycetocola sp. BIGb0189]|uniref:RecX family transcriptional regulator n=1 Tax=Mycetocola sp. BIGb0189 TaxID=2940604 RepID=UPI00216A33F7|nr:RecX family transcriptional regulator [Mycetocola sp. BIGb0189]MCS4275083.1 SOS response regulatory protein OraA/RecX [Mycetocola sp. BIGb0189]